MQKLLIIKVGRVTPETLRILGDYEEWFMSAMSIYPMPLQIVNVDQGEKLPSCDNLAGILITGSAAMVTDKAAWSENTASWLRNAVQTTDIPILGVCYGHQLLAHALGGVVANNPRGREVGTKTVYLTAAAATDPLFKGLPETLQVQELHRQSVLELPENATVLACNAHDPHQAYTVGQRAWGVQFHPEFTAKIIQHYLIERAAIFTQEGLDIEAIKAESTDSNHGQQLLRQYVKLISTRTEAANA